MKPQLFMLLIGGTLCLSACSRMVVPTNDFRPPKATTTVVDDKTKLTYVQVSQDDQPKTIMLDPDVRYLVFGDGEDGGGLKRIVLTSSTVKFTDGTLQGISDFTGPKVPVSARVPRQIELRSDQKTTLTTVATDYQNRQATAAALTLHARFAEIHTGTYEVPSQNNSGQLEYAAWTLFPNLGQKAPECMRHFATSRYKPREFQAPSVLQGETAYVVDVHSDTVGSVRFYSFKDNCFSSYGLVRFSQADVNNRTFKPMAVSNLTVDGIWVVAPDSQGVPSSPPNLILRWVPKKTSP